MRVSETPRTWAEYKPWKGRILISEIFGPTVQGEGPLIGRPTVFVRTGGCDYRCTWCDTLYAVLPEYRAEWMLMTPAEIVGRVDALAKLDWLILSPKPPSAGMATDWAAFDACLEAAEGRPCCALKIVVFNDADYAYAQTAAARYPALPVYLQVGNPTPLTAAGGTVADEADIDDLLHRFRWLVGKVTTDRWFAATVLPQLHVLAWGNKRGV